MEGERERGGKRVDFVGGSDSGGNCEMKEQKGDWRMRELVIEDE